MPEFLDLVTPTAARQRLLSRITRLSKEETIPVELAAGRILAGDIHAPHPLPEFRRATVDGFALTARSTFSASDGLPVYLNLVGEILMGASPEFSISSDQCASIHTGGMLPAGADAVVMSEYTEMAGPDKVEIFRPVSKGENTLDIGEDVIQGELVIPAGKRLRAAEIGGLTALGFTFVRVVKRPRVAILSSGNEVIPPGAHTDPGQVRDINSYSLSVLAEQVGAVAVRYGISPDDEQALFTRAAEALAACDLLVITAGSSASSRDITVDVLDALGEPGVLVHGVQLRPGKPTILGLADGKPVIGLPGNPVSALVAARLFVLPVIERLAGVQSSQLKPTIKAILTINVSSQAGREDWIPVKVIDDPEEKVFLAEPVFGRSNLIFTLVRADGLICIPLAANGLEAGQTVDIFPL